MVHQEQWVPGATTAGDTLTLPTYAPGIGTITAAYILRGVGFTVGDHVAADVALALADHAVHGHDITTVGPAGGGVALTEPALGGPFESAGGGRTNAGVVDVLAAAQAHGAGVAVAHVVGAGNPIVASTATRTARNTITSSVDTLVGDIYVLRYLAEGFVIRS